MRWLDFFFALRPLVLVPAWSFFILGAGLAHADAGAAFPVVRLALLSLVLVATYLINQVIDFESDRINDKGYFLQRGIFSRRLYVVVASVCLMLALGAAVAGGHAPALLGASALLGLAYSIPPLRLSARAGLDLLANGLGYGCLALLLGAGDAWSWSVPWGARLAACFLAVAAVFLHTTALDIDGDQRTGKRTVGVVLGLARTRGVAAGVATSAAASAAWSGAPQLIAACTVLALACVWSGVAPRQVSSRSICVGGTALFAVIAAMFQPWFLVAILVLAALTRIYYKKRFSLAYPAL